ncbi:MAG TPA: DEAD/DEAH box helicase family protein [Polyangiaceae bacterium]|nr:DEAD/DEAH box helicase family protein [Polyangiaceae bacterium]
MGVELRFSHGTIEVAGLGRDEELPQGRWDERSGNHRAPGLAYPALVRHFHQLGVKIVDHARAYSELELSLVDAPAPRPFQVAALSAWKQAKHQGVVVLPTGAGKSLVALLALADRKRSALVVAPTLDLVRQWHQSLSLGFSQEVGLVGGGEHSLGPLTVTTYDSALLHMEHWGNRFGTIVFDECHHLPGESYALAAKFCIAPFRLGLTATPDRADGRQNLYDELVGPVVYQKSIDELAGQYLAQYETQRLVLTLTPSEREQYDAARGVYLSFIRKHAISMSGPNGFAEFIKRSSRSSEGREAMLAFRRQRSLAFAATEKLRVLHELLHRHRSDRTIVFTQDNATVYEVSRRFLVPAITHQTKLKERVEILSGLHEGRYRVIVTSRVLNEGVDVPSANVAIVLSGSGSVMEHVQRLGRILRMQQGKRAVLYELVSGDTSESNTSERRREHRAYRRGSGLLGGQG